MSTEQRVTIALLRGQPSYKKALKRRLKNIQIIHGVKIPLEQLLEQGINLALATYGEQPISGRLRRNPEKPSKPT
jgi:hypothetical protein